MTTVQSSRNRKRRRADRPRHTLDPVDEFEQRRIDSYLDALRSTVAPQTSDVAEWHGWCDAGLRQPFVPAHDTPAPDSPYLVAARAMALADSPISLPPSSLGHRRERAGVGLPSAETSVLVASMEYPNPGGVTTAVRETVSGLVENGCLVEIASPDLAELEFEIPSQLVGPSILERYWDLRSAALITTFEKSKARGDVPDVIVATDVVSAHRLMERTNIPVILVVHGLPSAEDVAKGAAEEATEAHQYLLSLERAAIEHAAAVVTVSESLRRRILDAYPIAEPLVIQNPVDADLFHPGDRSAARERLGWPLDQSIVFCPSRFNPFKGIEYLVAAAGEIDGTVMLTESPDVGQAGNVRVLEACSRDEMRDRYVAADLVVIPSVMIGAAGETSSFAAIEAGACDVPVLASDVGGLGEVCRGIGFATVPPSDPDALAEAVNRELVTGRVHEPGVIRGRTLDVHGRGALARQLIDILGRVDRPSAPPLPRTPFHHPSAAFVLAAGLAIAGLTDQAVRAVVDHSMSDDLLADSLMRIGVATTEAPRLTALARPPKLEALASTLKQRRYWRNPPVTRPTRGETRAAPKTLDLVYVANRVDPCGGARIVIEHANRLADRGHRVRLLATGEPPEWTDVRATYVKVPRGADWHAHLGAPDVVIATYWDQLADLSRCGAPLLYFEQGDFHLYDGIDATTSHHVRANIEIADRTITLSSGAEKALLQRYGVESSIIENAIDLALFRPRSRIGQRMIIVGSRSSVFKGIDELLDVWRTLKRHHPRLGLDWVTAERPEDIPIEEGLEIHVSPDQLRLAELYSSATVYVSASRYETFPLPPLEAMASGTVVVSYANAGITEYADDGANALLVEPGDTEGLVDAADRALREQGLRDELIASGLATAARYDWDRIVDDVEALLLQMACTATIDRSLGAWELSVTDRDFVEPGDAERFRAQLRTSTASEIELPVLVEGPPDHFVARWERAAWRPTGNRHLRLALPVAKPHTRPIPAQTLLMDGAAAEALATAESRFHQARTDRDRMEAIRWMLFSLIELERDDEAVALARTALARYPAQTDFHYLAGVLANLVDAHASAAGQRTVVLALGPAVETPEFLWNVESLASRLPSDPQTT